MKLKVSFRIMGQDLEPTEITTMLGVSPDVAHKAGELGGTAFSTSRPVYREGLWALSSSISSAAPLSAHLEELICRLGDAAETLGKLKWRGFRIDFFVGVFDVGASWGLDVDLKSLNTIARMSAALDLDVYT